MKIENNTTFIVNSKVTCRIENDQSFTVYNPKTDIITKISPLSKSILDMCNGKIRLDEIYLIVSEICPEFNTDQGKANFVNFFQKMFDRGILEITDTNITVEQELEVKS
jgi:hypothetical protein